MKLLTLI